MSGLSPKCFWVAAVGLGFVTLAGGSPLSQAPEPIRCAPCTPERQLACPAVAPDCEEVLREPGCGCCPACALKKDEPCGVYTARCGSGLRCHPREGDARPLHSLITGRAVCMELSEAALIQAPEATEHKESENGKTKNTAASPDQDSLPYRLGLVTNSKPFDPRSAAEAQESMKAKANVIRKKVADQGPCQTELQRALEKIAKAQQKMGEKFTKFYLPNCDRHGFYNVKQCETSLESQMGKCWCVTPWNGKKIPGSTELPGDAECQHYLSLRGQEHAS
ncbi:insulin-like growth factor-binding protein 1a [Lepisosteus oculatus]|nr:PREDICTED: insulin-like growth factor-binding protein 1 [Lepisosteus oculatus]